MTAYEFAVRREWWFGAMPETWGAIPLKHLCRKVSLYGANVPAEQYEAVGVRFLRTTDIRDDGSLAPGGVFIPEVLATEHLLSPGDFLISRSGTVGLAYVYSPADGPCAYAGYLIRYVLAQSNTARWLFYLTKTPQFRSWLASASIEATIANVNGEKYANLALPVPPLGTRMAIADYLDIEIARIDALIKAKENILAIVAEKRRALVTQAVTRGLDPKAPMRDSGVPWLGEMPTHWEEVRLRFLVDAIEQGWSPQADAREPADSEWGVLKLSAVNRGAFDPTAAKALPKELEPRIEYEVKDGDFLLTRANTPSLVGDACFVESTRPMLMLCDLIYRLRLRSDRIHGKYLAYFLTLPIGRTQIEADARGTSNSMVKISQEHIKSWRVPVPPVQEQFAIVEFLSREVRALDRMERATLLTVRLLRERREAVIAAAVTGQLDVGA